MHIIWKLLSIHSFSKPSWLVSSGFLEFSSSEVNSISSFCNLILSTSNFFARVSEVANTALTSENSISETRYFLINTMSIWIFLQKKFLSPPGFKILSTPLQGPTFIIFVYFIPCPMSILDSRVYVLGFCPACAWVSHNSYQEVNSKEKTPENYMFQTEYTKVPIR